MDVTTGGVLSEPVITIALIATLISFSITTLFYIIGMSFNLHKLKQWCKSEYFHLGATIFLIAFFTLTIIAFETATTEISYEMLREATGGTPVVDPYTGNVIPVTPSNAGNINSFLVSKVFINKALDCAERAYKLTYYIDALVEPVEKRSIGTAGSAPLLGWPLTGLVSLLHYIGNNLTFAMVAFYFLLQLISFSETTMLTVFLPIGIILRAFPLTRGAGALMMAIAIGMYFVFPLSFVIMIGMQGNLASSCSIGATDLGVQEDYCLNPSEALQQEAKVEEVLKDKTLWEKVEQLKADVATMILQALFYPVVAFMITFTFIRAVSSMFGGDLAELGRGLIKLI